MTKNEVWAKQAVLGNFIKEHLPDHIKAVRKAHKERAIIVMHQDAFAADYQDHEYYLLGCAIKYAGDNGVEVRIIGKNRETLK